MGKGFFDPFGNVCEYGEIDGVYVHSLRLGETVGNFVNPEDTGGTFEESPLGDTEAD